MQIYSNCFNIRVDGSFKRTQFGPVLGDLMAILYEAQVLRLLDVIGNTWSGYEFYTQVYQRGLAANKHITIQPYTPADVAQFGAANAFAETEAGEDFHAAAPRGAAVFAGGSDNPNTPTDERLQTLGFGTGGGTDARIHFSPDSPFSNSGPIVSQPEHVLFHEMVHALREMQGESDDVPTGAQDKGYDNVEEFFAILMTNIFVSEQNPNATLRKDHHGHTALPAAESTSEGFLLNNAENLFWIKYLYPQEMDYFLAVAGNPLAAFNPLREYVVFQPFYDALGSDVPTTTYVVVAGDTLSGIAHRLYGDGNKWRVIFAMNRDVIGPNPNLIFPGQALTVPVLA
jgi:nucleoid-associated protein YgaU